MINVLLTYIHLILSLNLTYFLSLWQPLLNIPFVHADPMIAIVIFSSGQMESSLPIFMSAKAGWIQVMIWN